MKRLAAALVLALAVSAVATTPPEDGAVVDAAPRPAVAPPQQRVLLVADSVGLGAEYALPAAFPPGWEVNTVGSPARFVSQLEANFVRPLLGTSLVGDHVVIAGGYNYQYWDPALFDREIDSMIATLTAAGVKHVYWVTLREVKPQYISAGAWRQIQPYYWYFPTVNEHFERAVLRHPNLTLIDWAAVADQPGLTYDAIHLNTTGAALYSRLVADAVFNASTRAPNRGVTPVGVGTGGGAVMLNVTTTATRRNGYLSAYPCDSPRPVVSNLNHGRDDTVAGAAVVPVGPGGEVCVYSHEAAQVVVDEFGTFGELADLADVVPSRLVDTRTRGVRQPASGTLRVDVTGAGKAPDGTSAVALSVTAVDAPRRGHVTVHPCSIAKPDTSNLNFRPGVATPNLVVAEPDEDGEICLTPSADTHLLVDLFAAFGPDTTVATIDPSRVVDTRLDATAPFAGRVVRFDDDLLAGALADDAAAGAGEASEVGAVIANLTMVDAPERGFATVYPCADGRPDTSNVNAGPGLAVANLVIVEPDAAGELCVYTNVAANLVVDVLGATGAGFDGRVPARLVDTRRR